MATIKVDIVSAEGEIHSGEATMVFAPAEMGEVGIAPRHAPLLTALNPGEVRVQTEDGKEESFYITGDDVLQFFQSLQHGLHATRAVIVLLTDNERVEDA